MKQTITTPEEESLNSDDVSTRKDDVSTKVDDKITTNADKITNDDKSIENTGELTKKENTANHHITKTNSNTIESHDDTQICDDSTNSAEKNTRNRGDSTNNDDDNTQNDDVSTKSDDSVYAPDGGWGWMVTLAGFMVAFIQDGLVTSFGLLLPDLLLTFGSSLALTSLPPAIMVSTFLISGPVTAYLVQRWGCRRVGMCGGLLAAVGVGASAFAPNIHLFLLTFGFLAGAGIGLIYLPSITMVNLYFHKKRGMVAGIITSGSGMGLLALAPLTEILMTEYGWRGCYLIMAAITLHFCVCASLMRPLPPRPPPSPSHPPHSLDNNEPQSMGSFSVVSVQELKDPAESDPLVSVTHFPGEGQNQDSLLGLTEDVENRPVGQLTCKTLSSNPEGLHLGQETHQHPSLFSSVKNLFRSHHVIGGSHVPTSGPPDPTQGPILRSRSQGHLESGLLSSHRPDHHLHLNALSTWLACQVPPSLSRHSLHSHQSSDNMAAGQHEGCDIHKAEESASARFVRNQQQHHQHHHHRHQHQQHQQQQQQQHYHSDGRLRYDCSLSSACDGDGERVKQPVDNCRLQSEGAAPLLSKKISSEDARHHQHRLSSAGGEAGRTPDREDPGSGPVWTSYTSRVTGWLRGQLVFLLFLFGAFLIQLVCYVPPLLTPSYAYHNGVSKEQVATILSVYGVLNTVGRLVAGVLVYGGVGSLQVYNVGTLLSAVACFTFPLSTSFPTLALTLGLHGFFLGAFPPLQSVILVEYLGLHRLTSTFGIMCMVKAFGSIAGAPLAGLLVTVSGTYTTPVAVCGGVLVLAVISHQLMACCP